MTAPSLVERAAALAQHLHDLADAAKQFPDLFAPISAKPLRRLAKAVAAGDLPAVRDVRRLLRRDRQPPATPALSAVPFTKRSKEATKMDALEPKPEKRKKKSKITRLAKAAAVEGGLDWKALDKSQRARIKAAVRHDRAIAKAAKVTARATKLAGGQSAASETPPHDGTSPRAAVDEEDRVSGLRKAAASSDPLVAHGAQRQLDALARESVRKALRTGHEVPWMGYGPGIRQ